MADAGLKDSVHIDSAGTIAYHVGHPPDARAQEAASRRGIDLSTQRARKVDRADFEQFDLVIAMDSDNRYDLEEICPTGLENRLHMFLTFARNSRATDVPDPYYGGDRGFETVLDMVEDASEGLLQHLKDQQLI